MSMVQTRSPLQAIGMNGAGGSTRRSARLSSEGVVGGPEEGGKRGKKTEGAGGLQEGVAKKKRKVYDEDDDDFAFTRSRKSKAAKGSAPSATAEKKEPAKAPPKEPTRQPSKSSGNEAAKEPAEEPAKAPQPPPAEAPPAPSEDAAPKRKVRRRLPTTPEREKPQKAPRRSKRISNEHEEATTQPQDSAHKPEHAKSHAQRAQAQAKSHANHERSPSPGKARPVTVEKKRRQDNEGVQEEKVLRIQLPFADTPVIKRNKEMRKASAENGSRRSSSGMRGRRASSLIDEGRGSALPHAEVSSADFFKHISAELTEPRRMRCLLGWCGTRALPSKPDAPKDNTAESNLEFQALQSARVIQEELSQDLVSKGSLSDWFSRDDGPPPPVTLRKKPNPRNIANAAKAEELEKELARLKAERAGWDALIKPIASTPSSKSKDPPTKDQDDSEAALSPLNPDLLPTPQRALVSQLQNISAFPDDTTNDITPAADPAALEPRLRAVTANLEFGVDQFAHGVHALSAAREVAERVAERTLADSATALEERERGRRVEGKGVGGMAALRGLARVLNGQQGPGQQGDGKEKGNASGRRRSRGAR